MGDGGQGGDSYIRIWKEETHFNFSESFVPLKLLLAYTKQKMFMNYSYMQFISM